MRQKDFLKQIFLRTGLAEKTISQIINGIAPISYETAEKLELVLGIPSRFWNARERSYREALVKLDEAKRLEKDVEWLRAIPLSVLIDRGYIQQDDDQRSVLRQALRFFGVSSVGAWHNTWQAPAAQYRGNAAQQKKPGYVAAWLRMGEMQAEAIKTDLFNAVRLKNILTEARMLTTASTKESMAKLTALLSARWSSSCAYQGDCGAGVSGAVRCFTKDNGDNSVELEIQEP